MPEHHDKSRVSDGSIAVFWINLARAGRLGRCMVNALEFGGWEHERFDAIDGQDARHSFIPVPHLFRHGSLYPGVARSGEPRPFRRTTRPELACLASWQKVIKYAGRAVQHLKGDLFLFMEDDAGSSLAVPDAWPFTLEDVARQADRHARKSGTPWTMVQLAPINARSYGLGCLKNGRKAGGETVWFPRPSVRSHGNAGILLHRRAFRAPFTRATFHMDHWQQEADLHVLAHPWAVRPVADKWIYSIVPRKSVYVLTYPLFCLEAKDSELHRSHVDSYPSAQPDSYA